MKVQSKTTKSATETRYRLWINYHYGWDDRFAPQDTWYDPFYGAVRRGGPIEASDVTEYRSREEADAACDRANAKIVRSRTNGNLERLERGEWAIPTITVRAVRRKSRKA
ncbi:MAG: hypothetical protein KF858_05020 [Candidatus Sumerlaeia bacterium]|nr:hypothetical protein [Candidatus Sumerlaeia bacterium]